jgi:general secretion pathway protein L
VELVLQSGRFLFQPLELPSRAADFLQGIVRTQIDRLTPWNVGEVAFGWTKPSPGEHDRIVITVAATATAAVQPYVQTMVGLGARSVAIFACAPPDAAESFPIKVWEESARDETALARVRYALTMALAITGIMAGIATAASAIIGANLDAQQDKLANQTASIRARMAALRPVASDAKVSARAALERRKQEAPSIVIILDTLSRILPDNSYVTELRVEGNKLRLLGHTSDAPSLIGLIEQSGRFANATFFAPTTRLTAGAGERFHIEATILPLGASQS